MNIFQKIYLDYIFIRELNPFGYAYNNKKLQYSVKEFIMGYKKALDYIMICGSNGAFWDSIEGIYNLERSNIFIELRVLITKMNFERLPQMAEFIYRTMPFIGCVVFMAIEPIGYALKNIQKIWIDPIDYMLHLTKAINILWRRDITVNLFNYQLCILHIGIYRK